MQLTLGRKKAPKHHHACQNYGVGPAKHCLYCEQRRIDEQRRRDNRGISDDLR